MTIRSTSRPIFGRRLSRWLAAAVLALIASGSSARAQDPTCNLDWCLATASARQPALAAARASLAAAESGKRGLDSLRFAVILSPDIPIRKQQACLGITIAAASLQQAEWETRYAVARTYWSVIYARNQLKVVDNVIVKLSSSHEKAVRFRDAGDPNIKVTSIDVDNLALNTQFARAKRAEVAAGVEKALAGLREAIGLGANDPLCVPDEALPELVAGFDKECLRQWALTNRGEMAQAAAAAQVAQLEITAQHRKFLNVQVPTFAAGADIHAKQVPQGVANGEYRPGAIGMEMPVFMIGHHPQRTERAGDLAERAQAVVEKTHNLIVLEADAAYWKWQEAAEKIKSLAGSVENAAKTASTVQTRFDGGNGTGEELMRARTQEDYAQAQSNEARFNHAVALATIERVTAGGYRMPTGPATVVMPAQPVAPSAPPVAAPNKLP